MLVPPKIAGPFTHKTRCGFQSDHSKRSRRTELVHPIHVLLEVVFADGLGYLLQSSQEVRLGHGCIEGLLVVLKLPLDTMQTDA